MISKIFKVTKIVDLIKEARKKSKNPAVRESAETEGNLYEKVNMIMTKGAIGSPELFAEIITVIKAESERAVKYLQAKRFDSV